MKKYDFNKIYLRHEISYFINQFKISYQKIRKIRYYDSYKTKKYLSFKLYYKIYKGFKGNYCFDIIFYKNLDCEKSSEMNCKVKIIEFLPNDVWFKKDLWKIIKIYRRTY